MKKTILFALLFIVTMWAISRTNDFAVWFNAEKFYRPIYSASFDIMNKGTTIKVKLKNSYDVKHGFSLVFPCKNIDYRAFTNLDGLIQYKFLSDNKPLEGRIISPPTHPILGTSNGECDLVLFTFDLPYKKTTKDVFLEVTLKSPITKLEKYRDSIRCEVSPAYWPK